MAQQATALINGLTEPERRRGLVVLLIDVFCMYTGFFMVIPLISVHYVNDLGWAAATIGLILGVRQLVQQGLTFAGGMIADMYGAKALICAGLFIRIIGYLMLAWAGNVALLAAACILAAIGGALFESPRAAAIAALTAPEERTRFYSMSGAIGGVGMAVGPLIGAALLQVNWTYAVLAGAACFSINLIQTAIMLPPVRVASGGQRLTYGIRLALQDRPFVSVTALLIGYWFMWVQLNISLPLIAQRLSGSANSVGLIYAVNSVMVVTLQYPIVRIIGRRFNQMVLLICGMLFASIGIGSVAFAANLPMLIGSVVVFSLGALIVSPTQQSVLASLANPAALGSYFGVSSLSLAFGGALGSWSGGILYGLGQQRNQPTLPWLSFAAVGLVATTGLAWLYMTRYRYSTPETQPGNL
jgi:DHA1 family multidrug resistance protein-like MFS transporter